MAKLLYINNELVDLDEKESPVACTFAVNDIGELKNRQGSTTNRLKLPLTENNRRIFGFPDHGPITQMQPYRRLPTRLIQNGINIIPDGYAEVLRVNNKIEIQVISGLINFFDIIEGRKLEDLDFSDLEHTWNLQTVGDSQSRTDGYVYPIIDYGGLSVFEKVVDVKQLRPAVFEKTIFQKIMSSAGFTYSGDIFQDERYLKTIYPFTKDKFEHGKAYGAINYSSAARSTYNQTFNNDFREHVVQFPDDAISDPSNSWDGNNYDAKDIMKVKISLKYSVDVRDTYKGGSTPSAVIKIQKFSGGWNDLSSNQHMAQGEFKTHTYYDQTLDAETELKANESIRVVLRYEPSTDRVLSMIYSGAEIQIEYLKQDVVFGQKIQLEATLPDITQKAFLISFMQRYGLTPQPDKHRKHLSFYSFKNLYNNKIKALDWTDKFINVLEEAEFKFNDYGQNNIGRYKKDDAVSDDIGIGVITVDNTSLKNEKDLFSPVFAASQSIKKLNETDVIEVKKIEDPLKSVEFKIKTEPRILIDYKISLSWVTFFDGTGSTRSTATPVSVPYFQKEGLKGLGFDELFNEYYTELKRMLTKARKVSKPAILSEIDILNLDFFIPIYDGKTGTYYYLNTVSNYRENRPTELELVKMN